MKRNWGWIWGVCGLLALTGCGAEVPPLEVTGSYVMEANGYDWGSVVDRVIVTLDQPVDQAGVEHFQVSETKYVANYTEKKLEEKTTAREITQAYLCDAQGEPVEEASQYVALELKVTPNANCLYVTNPETNMNVYNDIYHLTIEATQEPLTVQNQPVTTLDMDARPQDTVYMVPQFQMDTFQTESGVSYGYAYYTPEQSSDTLVVWLNGRGEGGTEGTDPLLNVQSTRVTSLIEEEFQSIMGGAYVVAPQCPTYWMDDKGDMSNTQGGAIYQSETSYYLESLHQFIAWYQQQCGAQRVILCGASNGGYMVMLMALTYPQEYDAYVPICEAYPDAMIDDQELKTLAELPMYFIYSRDDRVVDPEVYEIPTIQRLKEAGASQVHVSVTDQVTDPTGQFTDQEGNPYVYNGHFSWVYFFRNASTCQGCGQDVWSWMAQAGK